MGEAVSSLERINFMVPMNHEVEHLHTEFTRVLPDDFDFLLTAISENQFLPTYDSALNRNIVLPGTSRNVNRKV